MQVDTTTPELPAARRSRFFWLRIAVSIFFGVLTLALCVLWVRSYSHRDSFDKADSNGVSVVSFSGGTIQLGRITGKVLGGVKAWGADWRWTIDEEDLGPQFDSVTSGPSTDHWIFIPFSRLVLVLVAFMSLPWIRQLRWRFSLRTLLIATALVAVVLGLAVWAGR